LIGFTSQPVSLFASQSMNGATHGFEHAPASQVGVVFGLEGQTIPQLPQFTGSVCVSTHVAPHIVCPVEHAAAHSSVPPLFAQRGVPAVHA
jgi:hypothetical protein